MRRLRFSCAAFVMLVVPQVRAAAVSPLPTSSELEAGSVNLSTMYIGELPICFEVEPDLPAGEPDQRLPPTSGLIELYVPGEAGPFVSGTRYPIRMLGK